jgi:hypothetical protein
LTLSADLPFSVEANSVDRLAVTIGPDSDGSSDMGSIYFAEVRLILVDDTAVELGSYVLMSPIETYMTIEDIESGTLRDPDCMRDNVRQVDAAMASPGRIAPALAEFSSVMRSQGFSP